MAAPRGTKLVVCGYLTIVITMVEELCAKNNLPVRLERKLHANVIRMLIKYIHVSRREQFFYEHKSLTSVTLSLRLIVLIDVTLKSNVICLA